MTQKQMEFDFPRGRKLWILDQIKEKKLLPFRMQMTLRAIDNVARNDSIAQLSYSEIGDFYVRSGATAKRGVDELDAESLLIVEEVISSNGRGKNKYRIVWSNLLALIEDGSEEKQDEEIDVSPETFRPLKMQGPTPQNAGADLAPVRGPTSLTVKKEYITPPPITNPDLWEKVKLDLIKSGMGAWHGLMTQARANGSDPNRLLELTQFFLGQSGRWQPGALYHRILNDHPEFKIDQGWPGDSPEWKRKQKSTSNLKKYEQEKIQNQKNKIEDEKYSQELQKLENEFGPLLDSMNPKELTALAAQCGNRFFLSRFRLNGLEPSIRSEMLKRLKLSGSKDVILSPKDRVPEDIGT